MLAQADEEPRGGGAEAEAGSRDDPLDVLEPYATVHGHQPAQELFLGVRRFGHRHGTAHLLPHLDAGGRDRLAQRADLRWELRDRLQAETCARLDGCSSGQERAQEQSQQETTEGDENLPPREPGPTDLESFRWYPLKAASKRVFMGLDLEHWNILSTYGVGRSLGPLSGSRGPALQGPQPGSSPRKRKGLMKWLEPGIEQLTGHDVFISYSHRHLTSANYAPALAERLQQGGLDCHIDQWGSKPDTRLPEFLTSIIRRSRVLVVLGSTPANESSAIEEEILCFKERHDTIVPVELEGNMRDARWWKELPGLVPIGDPQSAEPASPSSQVVLRILNSCTFVRARKRRKIAILSASSAILLALIGITVLSFSWREALEQQALAQQARDRAVTLNLGSTAFQVASSENGSALELGLLLAAESYRRDPNVVAFLTIRRGLSLLPQPLGHHRVLSSVGEEGYFLSPDGARLIFKEDYSPDPLKVVDVAEGKPVGSIPGVSLPPSDGFSPDGRYFAARVDPPETEDSGDPELDVFQLISTTDGRPKGPPVPISEDVWFLALGPSGDTFAACARGPSEDDGVRIGRWQKSRRKDQILPLQGRCTALAMSPDGRHVAIGSQKLVANGGTGRRWESALLVWDTQEGALRANFPIEGSVEHIAFSFDSHRLAAVIEDTSYKFGKKYMSESDQLHVWSLDAELQRALPVISVGRSIEQIRFSQDNDNRIVLRAENSLLILDASGTVVRRVGGKGVEEQFGEIVDVSLTGTRVSLLLKSFSPLDKGDGELFDLERLDYSIAPAKDHSLEIPLQEEEKVLAMSSFGSRLYLERERELSILDRDGGRHRVALDFDPSLVSLSPGESRVLVCGKEGETFHLALIDNANLKVLWKHRADTVMGFDIESAATSDNGVVALTLSFRADYEFDNTYVFDTRVGAEWSFRSGSPPDPESYSWPGIPNWGPGEARISADGRKVILIDQEFDVATGQSIAKKQESRESWLTEYTLSQDSINGILSSLPPGRAGIVSVSQDRAFIAITRRSAAGIDIFRARDGEPVARIDAEASLVAFSRDGKWLLGAGDAGLEGWLFKQEDLLPEVARSVTRNLSDDEIKRYIRGGPYKPMLQAPR